MAGRAMKTSAIRSMIRLKEDVENFKRRIVVISSKMSKPLFHDQTCHSVRKRTVPSKQKSKQSFCNPNEENDLQFTKDPSPTKKHESKISLLTDSINIFIESFAYMPRLIFSTYARSFLMIPAQKKRRRTARA
jgi:hypothetical protein